MAIKKSENKSVFGIVFGIICGCLIAGYVVVITLCYTRDIKYSYNERSYLSYINHDEYEKVLDYAYHDRCYGSSNVTKTQKQFFALADYVEAAAMYKACKETGNLAGTEQYAAMIGRAQSELGNLDFAVKDVNARLNIQ